MVKQISFSKIVARGFQAYWRISRGLHLTAEACVIDQAGKVLLLRNASGWQLPATIVTSGESLETALRRELERLGILARRINLFWVYSDATPNADHTGLYVIPDWQAGRFLPDTAFFSIEELAALLPATTVTRIRDALDGRAPAEL